jgi:hypothetical protein
VNRETETGLAPALLEWLERADHEPVHGWAPDLPIGELRCHPDLVARLAEIARPIGDTRRQFVAGCPVIHHPNGRPIAAAAGTSWLVVRSALPAGALRSAQPLAAPLEPDWVELDPWAVGVAFARAVDLLRGHVARAYERAEADA